MRIRKRWPPPPPPLAPDPLSSTIHLPASSEEEEIPNPKELHYVLRPPSDSPNHPLRQPSDLQLLMVSGTNGWICSTSEKNDEKNEEQKKKKLKKDDYLHPNLTQEREEDAEEKKEAVSNLRNGKNPSAEAWLSSSNQVRGRWCEGERDFPLKKRKGSFEQKTSKEMIMEKEKMKMKTKMKSKTNKKLVFEEDGKEDEYRVNGHAISVKKKGNGGVLMEGSRCSRVNGRGWRCCQQTLVGYSLCEHHLGKGRLRSMSSFKSRGGSTITKLKKVEQDLALSPLMVRKSFEDEVKEDEEDDDDDADEEEEDEKPLVIISKKRKKIGMVKARSISSLLGQTLHAPPVTQQ